MTEPKPAPIKGTTSEPGSPIPCELIVLHTECTKITSVQTEKLKTRTPKQLLNKYSATKLEIDGQCIFRSSKRKVWTTYN